MKPRVPILAWKADIQVLVFMATLTAKRAKSSISAKSDERKGDGMDS